jgi:hypothetical protein
MVKRLMGSSRILEEIKMKTLIDTLAGTASMLAPIAASALFAAGSAWADSERFTAGVLSDPGGGIATASLTVAPASRTDFGEATRIGLFSAPISLKLDRLGDEDKATADIQHGPSGDAWRNTRPADYARPLLVGARGEDDHTGIPDLAGLSGEKYDTVVLVALKRHF